MNKEDVKVSRFLSMVLRHRPAAAGITLDAGGWADVEALLAGLAKRGMAVDRARLDRVVADNDKRRYAYDESGSRIRAVQGHSVKVDLELPEAEPPAVLWHGTVGKFLGPIRREGLKPGGRQHVHLSAEIETARAVGSRRGTPVVLTVDASAMRADGYRFYLSQNGVWLTATVPPAYLTFPPE